MKTSLRVPDRVNGVGFWVIIFGQKVQTAILYTFDRMGNCLTKVEGGSATATEGVSVTRAAS
jgi:hypothetical protein